MVSTLTAAFSQESSRAELTSFFDQNNLYRVFRNAERIASEKAYQIPGKIEFLHLVSLGSGSSCSPAAPGDSARRAMPNGLRNGASGCGRRFFWTCPIARSSSPSPGGCGSSSSTRAGFSVHSLVRATTKPEAERVGQYMIRPLMALERRCFLEKEGQVGYRWGREATEQETMDYLEFIARVTSKGEYFS